MRLVCARLLGKYYCEHQTYGLRCESTQRVSNRNCRYHYVGPYVTAEHRRALNNLIIERDGFEMFQVLTALLPPPTATLVCLNDSLSLAAWRLPAGQLLAYNRYLLDSRGGYPIPNPDPRVTYLVSISPTMQACMHPFDTLII